MDNNDILKEGGVAPEAIPRDESVQSVDQQEALDMDMSDIASTDDSSCIASDQEISEIVGEPQGESDWSRKTQGGSEKPPANADNIIEAASAYAHNIHRKQVTSHRKGRCKTTASDIECGMNMWRITKNLVSSIRNCSDDCIAYNNCRERTGGPIWAQETIENNQTYNYQRSKCYFELWEAAVSISSFVESKCLNKITSKGNYTGLSKVLVPGSKSFIERFFNPNQKLITAWETDIMLSLALYRALMIRCDIDMRERGMTLKEITTQSNKMGDKTTEKYVPNPAAGIRKDYMKTYMDLASSVSLSTRDVEDQKMKRERIKAKSPQGLDPNSPMAKLFATMGKIN